MRGGFLNTQQTLLNLSGNTAAISTIQTGSTIVGINISGSSKTLLHSNYMGRNFFGQDTSWLSISENQVVTRVGPILIPNTTIYTLETPSGLSVDDKNILVAINELVQKYGMKKHKHMILNIPMDLLLVLKN